MRCKMSLVTSSPVFMSENKTWSFHVEIVEDYRVILSYLYPIVGDIKYHLTTVCVKSSKLTWFWHFSIVFWYCVNVYLIKFRSTAHGNGKAISEILIICIWYHLYTDISWTFFNVSHENLVAITFNSIIEFPWKLRTNQFDLWIMNT